MVDHVNRKKRSEMMRAVRTKNGPYELLVRSALHRMGYRFRLHGRDLPGSPDIVLPRWGVVIFVHGCYWHRHGCKKTTTPKSNIKFWKEKFKKNIERDQSSEEALAGLGWRVVIIWQCEASSLNAVTRVLSERLAELAIMR